MHKINKMKWNKSYFDQCKECTKNGNRFIIDVPLSEDRVVVCVEFKSYCCSKNCFEKRWEGMMSGRILKDCIKELYGEEKENTSTKIR